ncbi:MAG: DUF6146 family protein [Bacteroidota bacterium]
MFITKSLNTMKKLMVFILAVFSIWSCIQQKKIAGSPDSVPVILLDSTEYEITIIDPDFEQWYLLHYSPAKDRSNDFYRSKNNLGINNWNHYFTTNKYSQVVGSSIDVNPGIDYGIEVNRKLYWYFIYIEDNFKIRLLH